MSRCLSRWTMEVWIPEIQIFEVHADPVGLAVVQSSNEAFA